MVARPFLLSALLAVASGPLIAGPAPQDWTGHRAALFTATGDVTIVARKMRLSLVPLGSVSGDGGANVGVARDTGENALKTYAAKALISNIGWVTQIPGIGSQIAAWAASQVNPWAIAAAAVVYLYDRFVTSNNTRERAYLFYAPVAGRYHVNVHFKGHWLTKPANIITVIASNGAAVLNNTRVLSGDGDYDYFVNLPEGSSIVKVGLGSGSVNFHTAGQPNYVWLDDTVARRFTTKGVPLLNDRVSIASFAKFENRDATFTSTWSANSTSLMDGYIAAVENVVGQPVKEIDELEYREDYNDCGRPTPAIDTIQLDAHEIGTPQTRGQSVSWTLHRDPNRYIRVKFGAPDYCKSSKRGDSGK